MSCDCDTSLVITESDLAGLKSDLQTINDVVESPDLTTTTKSGREVDTLTGALTKLGYQPPVAYAGGISFTGSDGTKTIERNGIVYAPLPSALPFTTSGTWAADDEDKFFVVQSVMLYSGDVIINYPTVVNMQADASLQLGNVVHTEGYLASGDGGGARYRVYPSGTFTPDGGTSISLTASGHEAIRIPDSDQLNVAQYGATGNGTVDDTAAVQAAVDAHSFFGGGEVLFPTSGGGVFKCNIVLRPGVSLRGYSRDVSLIPATNSPVVTLQADANVQRVAIRELTIDGTATQGSFVAQDGVRSAPDVGFTHRNVTVEDCLIKNCGSAGVIMFGANTDDTVEHVGLFRVLRTDIEGCTGPGVRGYGNVALPQIDGCTIRDNGDENTKALSNVVFERSPTVLPRRISITNNLIETEAYVATGYALALLGVLDTLVAQNQFEEFHTAVLVDDSPNGVVTVDGNGFARAAGAVTAVGEVTNVNGFIWRGNNVDAATTGPVGLDLPANSANAKRVEIGSTNSWGGLTVATSGLPVTIIAPADTSIDLPNNSGPIPLNLTVAGAATVDTLNDVNSGTSQFVHGDTITLNIKQGGRTVTLDHGTGNILLTGGANFTLNELGDRIALQWDADLDNWVELSRSSVT